MESRIPHPAMTVPGALDALRQFSAAIQATNLPRSVTAMVALRASQINGCSACVDIHARELRALGEPDTRIFTLAAWREAPYFSEAERAALALTEAATRIADRPDSVSDEIWTQAAEQFDEQQLAALVLGIAAINTWNRINATTRQITGEWVQQLVDASLHAEAQAA